MDGILTHEYMNLNYYFLVLEVLAIVKGARRSDRGFLGAKPLCTSSLIGKCMFGWEIVFEESLLGECVNFDCRNC